MISEFLGSRRELPVDREGKRGVGQERECQKVPKDLTKLPFPLVEQPSNPNSLLLPASFHR